MTAITDLMNAIHDALRDACRKPLVRDLTPAEREACRTETEAYLSYLKRRGAIYDFVMDDDGMGAEITVPVIPPLREIRLRPLA